MDLPGSPRTHVWGGMVIALVGVALGGYAYTGDRAYEFTFIFVAVLGFALVVTGSLLTGYGQANRPRMGGRKKARDAAKGEEDGDEAGADGGLNRLSTAIRSVPAKIRDRARGQEVAATLACNACGHVFEARGHPPFDATCPQCDQLAQVGKPQPVETHAEPFEIQGSPRRASTSEAGAPTEPEATATSQEAGGDRPPLTQRLRDRVAQARGDPLEATLACQHCDHVFQATGTPPFHVTCPNCGYAGRVETVER